MKSSEEILIFRGTMTILDGKFGKGLALGLLTLGYVILFFSLLDM